MKHVFVILLTALTLLSCSETETKSIPDINKVYGDTLISGDPHTFNYTQKSSASDTDKVYRDTLNSGHAYTFNYPQKYSVNWVENCIYIGWGTSAETMPDWFVCVSNEANLENNRADHSDNLQRETSINEPVYCKTDKCKIGNYTADRYRYYTKKDNIYISEDLIIDIGEEEYFSITNQIQRETRSPADSIEFYKFLESFKISK